MTTGKRIVIADYDPAWPAKFEAERDLIVRTCGAGAFVSIQHVGSTSVPGLAAKPIIDMMPGVRSLDDAPPLVPLLESIGYEYVPEFEHDTPSGPGMPFRRYFRKDANGERAYHLHMVEVAASSGSTTCCSATTCAPARRRSRIRARQAADRRRLQRGPDGRV